MIIRNLTVGAPVQHRAWFWIGKIVEIPEGEIRHSTTIKVELPNGAIQTYAMFSLISEEEDFVYDWSEFDEAPRRRTKSKSKKRKH